MWTGIPSDDSCLVVWDNSCFPFKHLKVTWHNKNLDFLRKSWEGADIQWWEESPKRLKTEFWVFQGPGHAEATGNWPPARGSGSKRKGWTEGAAEGGCLPHQGSSRTQLCPRSSRMGSFQFEENHFEKQVFFLFFFKWKGWQCNIRNVSGWPGLTSSWRTCGLSGGQPGPLSSRQPWLSFVHLGCLLVNEAYVKVVPELSFPTNICGGRNSCGGISFNGEITDFHICMWHSRHVAWMELKSQSHSGLCSKRGKWPSSKNIHEMTKWMLVAGVQRAHSCWAIYTFWCLASNEYILDIETSPGKLDKKVGKPQSCHVDSVAITPKW